MIYEWDYRHGNIEVYDRRGKHLGDRLYPSGEPITGPVRTRSVEP
jgi:hypothetical protein